MNNLDKKTWKKFFKATRPSLNTDHLERRARTAQLIKDSAEGGKVAVVIHSTDCDHTSGYSVEIIPANVPAFLRVERHTYDWAEGYTSIAIDKPSVARHVDTDTVRDGILEAFEDGHAHLVTA